MSDKQKIERFLTIIGLLFSGATAYFAYSIGNEQIRAAKIQYAPIFTFKREYIKDYAKDVYKEEYFLIENQGYPILTFNVELDTVLTLKLIEQSKNTPSKVRYYSTSYFNVKSSSSGGKGRLSTFIGNDNLWLMSDFQNETISFNGENNGKIIVNYVTNTIIKISYTDVNEEEHDKYFIDEKPVSEENYNNLKSKIKGQVELGKRDLKLYKLLSIGE